jgi:hypothetical protein
MYTAIVVTHAGPCKVTKELLERIDDRKKREDHFGAQILFLIELDLEDQDVEIVDGSIELIKQMGEFEKKFISSGGAAMRSISL